MGLATALIIVLFCTLLAGAVSVFVHRTVHIELRRKHNEIGTAVFLQLGVIFAVLLAFVFSEVWSQYNNAGEAVEMECSALQGAAVLASALPAQLGAPILAAEQSYIASVIRDEWPMMFENRGEDLTVAAKLTQIIQATARLRPGGPADMGTRQQLLGFLEEANAHRSERIFQIGSGVPMLLWCLLIGFGIVLAAFVTMAGVDNGGALVSFSMTFAAAVAAILVLIHLLDFPFEGALALGPGPFMMALKKVALIAQSAP
jgi:hypothetical protein